MCWVQFADNVGRARLLNEYQVSSPLLVSRISEWITWPATLRYSRVGTQHCPSRS